MVRSNPVRTFVACVGLCLLSKTAAVAFGPVPFAKGVPAPSCPEYLIGEIDGCYYYATSDCRGLTGYGQSNQLIPLPQCSEGSCGRTVSTPGGELDPPDEIPQGEIDGWITAINETRALLAKEIAIRTSSDSRLSDLKALVAKADATIAVLRSGAAAPTKFTANSDFNREYGDFKKDTARVEFAEGYSTKISIEDRPPRRAVESQQLQTQNPKGLAQSAPASLLKSADEITWNTSVIATHNAKSTLPAFTMAKAEKDEIVTVEIAAGQLAYFQCFRITVKKTASSPTETLFVGVQVSASNKAKTGRFSERGNYAHRITNSRGTPFLVNSYDDLGAK